MTWNVMAHASCSRLPARDREGAHGFVIARSDTRIFGYRPDYKNKFASWRAAYTFPAPGGTEAGCWPRRRHGVAARFARLQGSRPGISQSAMIVRDAPP